MNTNEVFVLASQCEQVDYIEDMKDSVWLAVNKTTPRDLYFRPSIVDNNEVPDDQSLNNEAAYQEDVPQINRVALDETNTDNVCLGLHRTDFEEENISGPFQEILNITELPILVMMRIQMFKVMMML